MVRKDQHKWLRMVLSDYEPRADAAVTTRHLSQECTP